MAPVNSNIKAKRTFTGKGGRDNPANNPHGSANKQKRKWVSEHKVFDGSVGEGNVAIVAMLSQYLKMTFANNVRYIA